MRGDIGRRGATAGSGDEVGGGQGSVAVGGQQPRPMPTRLSGLAAIIAARSEDSPEKLVRFFSLHMHTLRRINRVLSTGWFGLESARLEGVSWFSCIQHPDI